MASKAVAAREAQSMSCITPKHRENQILGLNAFPENEPRRERTSSPVRVLPMMRVRHLLLLALVAAGSGSGVDAACKGTVVTAAGSAIPRANVSACGASVLTAANGSFAIDGCGPPCTVAIWARQFLPVASAGAGPATASIVLQPRPIPGFPASNWRFEGWAIDAQHSDVPGTNISFLAHPSAYRPPSGGRVFLTSTANTHAGPGWTQGYWQDFKQAGGGEVVATALAGPLVNRPQAGLSSRDPAQARTVYEQRRRSAL